MFVDMLQTCIAGHLLSLVRALDLLVDPPCIALPGIQISKVVALRFDDTMNRAGKFAK
jgi:hypothetical protein